jgi:hypothetical protein
MGLLMATGKDFETVAPLLLNIAGSTFYTIRRLLASFRAGQ